jgi:hypothetical protein
MKNVMITLCAKWLEKLFIWVEQKKKKMNSLNAGKNGLLNKEMLEKR